MEAGFLNIKKPLDWTSYKVISELSKISGIKKMGHSGTLDPFATGVLVVGINNATRLLEYIESDKTYIAEVTFGIETDTDDITGKVIKESSIIPSLKEIESKLKDFTGKILQKPPAYSALKINGQRAYKLARNNSLTKEDIKERIVEVYSLKLVSHLANKVKLEIHCSSGTYIRSIARDLGKQLNSCAVLSNLVRTKVGSFFRLEEGTEIDKVTKQNFKDFIIPAEAVIKFNKLCFNEKQASDLICGKMVNLNNQFYPDCSENLKFQILDNNNALIAIAELREGSKVYPLKVFHRI